MKFDLQFEYHKIPEWYTMYLDYKMFRDLIEGHKEAQQQGTFVKVSQIWRFKQTQDSAGNNATWNLFIDDKDQESWNLVKFK